MAKDSIYFIIDDEGEIYQLDATLDFNITDRGSLTNYVTSRGETLSDHYTHDPLVFNLSGKISDVKLPSTNFTRVKSTDKFISGLRALKQSNKTFSFVWRNDKYSDGVTYLEEDCIFELLSFSQNRGAGYDGYRHSYDVSLQIKQIRYGTQADVEVVKADFLQGTTAEKKISAGSGKGLDLDEVSENDTPYIIRLANAVLTVNAKLYQSWFGLGEGE